MAAKPLRAPLLLAVVVSPKREPRCRYWEQEAVASGVAHALSLVLDEAGWGVMWRTGLHTRVGRRAPHARAEPDEKLLGWLYVGGKPSKKKSGRRKSVNAKDFLTTL